MCEMAGMLAYSLCTAPETAQTCLVQSSRQDLVCSGHLHKAELNSTTPGCILCNLQQGLRTMLYSSVNILAIGSLALYIPNHVRQAAPTVTWMAGLVAGDAADQRRGTLNSCSCSTCSLTGCWCIAGTVVDCITGKGLHSSDGTCKLREELFSWVREEGFHAELRKPHNDGVVVCLTAKNAGWKLEGYS